MATVFAIILAVSFLFDAVTQADIPTPIDLRTVQALVKPMESANKLVLIPNKLFDCACK